MSTVDDQIEKKTQKRVAKLFRKQIDHDYRSERAEAIRSGKRTGPASVYLLRTHDAATHRRKVLKHEP